MYKYFFYFIYKGQLKDNKGTVGPSKSVACMFVGFLIFLQFVAVWSITKFAMSNYTNANIHILMGKTYSQKWIWTFFLLLPFYLFANKYFTAQKIEEITNYYSDKSASFYSVINFVKFFLILLIPLAICIYFSSLDS